MLAFHSWLTVHVTKPTLAFPFGVSLTTAAKKLEYLKQLSCTIHHSQNLQSKQLEMQIEPGKEMLKKLLDQRQSKQIHPSLAILLPNLGPTALTYLYELHKTMDSALIKEGYVLCTFNPTVTSPRNKKQKFSTICPPVPFILLRKLQREDYDYLKGEPNLEISYHHYFVLNPN